MIKVILNGQPETLAPDLTVLALLEARGLAGKLADGDRLEIVVAVGGG